MQREVSQAKAEAFRIWAAALHDLTVHYATCTSDPSCRALGIKGEWCPTGTALRVEEQAQKKRVGAIR